MWPIKYALKFWSKFILVDLSILFGLSFIAVLSHAIKNQFEETGKGSADLFICGGPLQSPVDCNFWGMIWNNLSQIFFYMIVGFIPLTFIFSIGLLGKYIYGNFIKK